MAIPLVCKSEFLRWSQWEWNTCSTSYSFTLFATLSLGGTDKLELWKDKKIKALLLSMFIYSSLCDWGKGLAI